MVHGPHIVGVQEVSVEVIEMLKCGISGERIARMLGVSRTSVWKFVKKLEDLGYVIERKRGLGYRILRSPDISPYEVASVCRDLSLIDEVYYYKVTDSTNLRAREVAKPRRLFVAERQTKGRGRYGRSWMSEEGGLYFSITLSMPIEYVPRLTLTTGVSIARVLNAKLKWPNDVMFEGRKLCGILCELVGGVEDPLIIVGIGINVNNPSCGISLKEIYGREVSRIDVLSRVLRSFERYYFKLLSGDWDEIRREWIDLSETLGRYVKVRTVNRTYEGFALDLDEDGGLMLDVGGKVVKVFSGDCFYA
ncbi:MAG: biotin--[acetyl-CoA-carboxylase] ligase [Archaeoglobales archaeon]|nr:MAG: biotin--[acetyl-CoA-carboxylase] ligase [Archaeoglobales archaeon]